MFLSSRPHENISHSTEDCSNPPEADQRSSSPQEHSYDPQWRRRWTHRAQPAGTTSVICSASSKKNSVVSYLDTPTRYQLPCADLTLNCMISGALQCSSRWWVVWKILKTALWHSFHFKSQFWHKHVVLRIPNESQLAQHFFLIMKKVHGQCAQSVLGWK